MIELRQANKARNGNFQPQAYLKLTPALRAFGLLLALPAEDLKNLLFMLSFVTPNGDCRPAATQLAQAMRVSVAKAHTRLQRLTQFKWQGDPLVVFLRAESGIDGYMPHPRLIAYEHTEAPNTENVDARPPYRAAGRAAVIAYSRARYARPRAEVEREMAQRMGWPLPPDEAAPSNSPEKAPVNAPSAITPSPSAEMEAHEREQIKRRLIQVGISQEQAEALLQRFDLLRIRRQLHWLPYRKVRNPAGFLVAAIEDNYEAPPTL